jgi:hypothetical protein
VVPATGREILPKIGRRRQQTEHRNPRPRLLRLIHLFLCTFFRRAATPPMPMAAAGTSAVLSSAPPARLIGSAPCHLRLPPPAAAIRRRLLRRCTASGGGGDGSDQAALEEQKRRRDELSARIASGEFTAQGPGLASYLPRSLNFTRPCQFPPSPLHVGVFSGTDSWGFLDGLLLSRGGSPSWARRGSSPPRCLRGWRAPVRRAGGRRFRRLWDRSIRS